MDVFQSKKSSGFFFSLLKNSCKVEAVSEWFWFTFDLLESDLDIERVGLFRVIEDHEWPWPPKLSLDLSIHQNQLHIPKKSLLKGRKGGKLCVSQQMEEEIQKYTTVSNAAMLFTV